MIPDPRGRLAHRGYKALLALTEWMEHLAQLAHRVRPAPRGPRVNKAPPVRKVLPVPIMRYVQETR